MCTHVHNTTHMQTYKHMHVHMQRTCMHIHAPTYTLKHTCVCTRAHAALWCLSEALTGAPFTPFSATAGTDTTAVPPPSGEKADLKGHRSRIGVLHSVPPAPGDQEQLLLSLHRQEKPRYREVNVSPLWGQRQVCVRSPADHPPARAQGACHWSRAGEGKQALAVSTRPACWRVTAGSPGGTVAAPAPLPSLAGPDGSQWKRVLTEQLNPTSAGVAGGDHSASPLQLRSPTSREPRLTDGTSKHRCPEPAPCRSEHRCTWLCACWSKGTFPITHSVLSGALTVAGASF